MTDIKDGNKGYYSNYDVSTVSGILTIAPALDPTSPDNPD